MIASPSILAMKKKSRWVKNYVEAERAPTGRREHRDIGSSCKRSEVKFFFRCRIVDLLCRQRERAVERESLKK